MKFVIANLILDTGSRKKIRVNPRLVEEISQATYVDHEGETRDGARLTYQTGRSITIAESDDAIAGALSRGFDQ